MKVPVAYCHLALLEVAVIFKNIVNYKHNYEAADVCHRTLLLLDGKSLFCLVTFLG